MDTYNAKGKLKSETVYDASGKVVSQKGKPPAVPGSMSAQNATDSEKNGKFANDDKSGSSKHHNTSSKNNDSSSDEKGFET